MDEFRTSHRESNNLLWCKGFISESSQVTLTVHVESGVQFEAHAFDERLATTRCDVSGAVVFGFRVAVIGVGQKPVRGWRRRGRVVLDE